MRISDQVTKDIIVNLLTGKNYRTEVLTLINASFLEFAIDFFKLVAEAKFESQDLTEVITFDWYKNKFLNKDLPPKVIAINSGLNLKTIKNLYNTQATSCVIDAADQHLESLLARINLLVDTEQDLDLTLTIKFKGVSVELSISESLIVINTLAVKRAELRGGLWSTAGKRVEKPLMITLCKLFSVEERHYEAQPKNKPGIEREVDFYLTNNNSKYKCEVKLMGSGNPESADAAFAREGTKVLIADNLNPNVQKRLDNSTILWMKLQDKNRFHQFKNILNELQIPFTDFQESTLKRKLKEALRNIFNE